VSLGWITNQHIHFGGPVQLRINDHILPTIQLGIAESKFDKLLDRMLSPGATT
jgi:hypothetical protein